MSSMGPEIFVFLKKLEDNNDKLPDICKDRDASNMNFEYNNPSCHACNGYYGPNFGEPVCVTCHAFLFPDFPSYVDGTTYYFTEKTDDGDSGNDEPSDLNYSLDKRLNKISLPQWLSLTLREQLNYLEASPDDYGALGINMPSGSGCNNHRENGGNPIVVQECPDIQRPWPSGSVHVRISAKSDLTDNTTVSKKYPDYPVLTPNLARTLQALSTPHLPYNLPAGLLEQLPSEVLLCIFSYLDDMSLCACAFVCDRWQRLVRAYAPPARWEQFTARRWPLYKPQQASVDWLKKYESLVASSFCRHCLVQMCASVQPKVKEMSHWRHNRLRSELKMLRNDPPEGIAATPLDPKCCHWQASITGPVGSPYEGGIFYLYIQVPFTYPMEPPVVRFVTRILHPNVSRHGDVGIDSVQHNWSLALTVSKVLISIQSLLTDPYTAVCMEPEIGEMYIYDRTRFETFARTWTWRYAMHDILNI